MLTVDLIKELTAFNEDEEDKHVQRHLSKVERTKVISGALFQVLEQIETYLAEGYRLQPQSQYNQIAANGSGYLQVSLLIPDHLLTDELETATVAGKQEYQAKLDADKQILLEKLIKEEEEAELQAQLQALELAREDRKADLLKIIK